MNNRNTQPGPHCVDLNTSTNWSAQPQTRRSAEQQSSRLAKPTIGLRNCARPASGAVRRSELRSQPGQQRHLGKLTAAAAIVATIAVLTVISSEPFAIDNDSRFASGVSLAGVQTDNQPPVLEAAIKTPSFFFDDNTDALDRSFTKDKEAADTTSPVEPLLNLTAPAEVTNKASEALVAMVAIPSTMVPTSSATDDSSAADQPRRTEHGEQQILPADDAASVFDKAAPSIKEAAAEIQTQTQVQTTAGTLPGTRSVTVVSGDTLSGILNRNGLDANELNQLLVIDQVKQHLTDIDIGQIIDIEQDASGRFTGLTTRADANTRINVDRSISGFEVSVIDLPVERQRQIVSGEIEQSLYLTAEQAELKQSTIMELANIFQWELDFAREIRKGDRFSLVYDKLYREGEYIGDGDILAAEFVRGGKSYQAIHLTKEDGTSGYYSPEGESKKRTFMRHPVDVVRITSKFNPNRMHPVLHRIQAHRGVDYGAPHGSPIYATADGTVIHAGPKSAYGNTVVLKHAQKFSTLYAHMDTISKNSVAGARVKQGDVIGYVGRTGRVTGTHLHYEFRVNGEQIDPLKVDLPKAEPLAQKYRAELARLTKRYGQMMTASLEELENSRLAQR